MKNSILRFTALCFVFALLVIPAIWLGGKATGWTVAVIVTASLLLTYMTRESP